MVSRPGSCYIRRSRSTFGLHQFGRRTLSVMSVVSVLVLVTAACSSSSSSSSKTSSSANRTLTVVTPAVPSTLDPAQYNGESTDLTYETLISTLVKFPEVGTSSFSTFPSSGNILPYLASSWTESSGGAYTFVLRSAKSQYGNPLTAEDVKWSFERDIALDYTDQFFAPTYLHLNSKNPITVLSANTFRFNVTSFTNLLLPVLTYYGFAVLDATEAMKHATSSDPWATKWLATHSATFGPYEASSFQPGASLVLSRNPYYFGSAPAVSEVNFRAVSDAASRLALVEAGSADMATSVTYAQLKSIGTSGSTVAVPAVSPFVVYMTTYDLTPPFTSALVRRALSLAINRQALVASVYAGYGTPAAAELPTFMSLPPGASALETSSAGSTAYDPAEAKALLKQAGYPHGFSFNLYINNGVGPGPEAVDEASIIEQELAQIGVTAHIVNVGAEAQFSAGLFGHKYDAELFEASSAIQDPGYFITLLYTDKGGKIWGYFNNAQLNQLAAQIVSTPRGPTWNRLVLQAMGIVNQQLPMIPLVQELEPWVIRSDVVLPGPQPVGSLFFQDVSFRG